VEKKVFQVIASVMNVPESAVNASSSPQNIERWDSLKHMNLILALEDEFRVQFTDAEIVDMTVASKIIETLKEKL
jgi:acyl carrier protein